MCWALGLSSSRHQPLWVSPTLLFPLSVSVWVHNRAASTICLFWGNFSCRTYTHCFSESFCLWDAPPFLLLEPAVELGAQWMALCDLAVVPVWKIYFSHYPSTLCGPSMTTLWNNGLNKSLSCHNFMQRSPISDFQATRPSDKMSTTLTQQSDSELLKYENQQTLSCSLSNGHSQELSLWWECIKRLVKSV